MGAFSVAGVPPSAGFFGKAALFDAGVQAGSAATVVLLFVGGALTFVYLFQIYQHTYWRPPPAQAPAPAGPRAVVAAIAVLVLLVGLWPEPLLALGDQAGGALLGMVR
jgi:multicomponent Na+:H+ antiporter subunit D